MDRKIYYLDKNKIKQKNNKNNNEPDNSNIDNLKDDNANEIDETNLNDVLDKMKNNINNLKLHKQIKEKSNIKIAKDINNINIKNNVINNKDNIIINSINIENNYINNNSNILYINNNKNDLSQKELTNLINDAKTNNNIDNIKNINQENTNNISNNNNDENLNIDQSIKMNQNYNNIKISNKPSNKNNNIKILQNLRGISNQNARYGSTLMSNVSYSSFLSFKNKKVKFVNLNPSANQSLINNKSIQDEIKKQEEEDNERIDKKEQEKMMKNILDRLGGNNEIIKENENELEQEDNNINKNKEKNMNIYIKDKNNINKIQEENESLLFNITKTNNINSNQDIMDQNNKDIKQDFIEKEKRININNIKCTLSLLDKGKAIFVSEDDDIFWLPSSTLNENIKVGNSYLFQIDKINNQIKKLNEIEMIQSKYKEWK